MVKVGPVTLVPTGAAYYAYDESGRVLGEYDANLVPVYETVYTDVGPVAVVKQDRSTQVVQTQVNYVYADQIGTPRVITRNTDNAIVWRWDQAEPFGATPPDQNPNGLGVFAYNQRMPGQVYDAESATFYNWHRTYDPATGRYLQSDPIGLGGGLNTYAYVGGNPVSLTDPTGKCPWCIGGAILGGGINLAVQLSQNGHSLSIVDWLHVGVAAATGALGGGIGAELAMATRGLSAGWNLGVNIAGNAAIGGALGAGATAYQNVVAGECGSVKDSAIAGAIFAGAGTYAGAAIGAVFNKLGTSAQNIVGKGLNALLPNGAPFNGAAVSEWFDGAGAAFGNATSNAVSNSTPIAVGP